MSSKSILLFQLAFIGAFIFHLDLKAQMNLPDMLAAHLGPGDHNDLYENSFFKELKTSSSSKIWKVWSDRDENPIYDSPRQKRIEAQARWMEEFEVWDIKKTSSDEVLLKIKSPAASIVQKEGWIPLAKTLASSKALANEFGLTRKYMILTPVENYTNGNTKALNARFYNSPRKSAGPNYDMEVNRFTILFVLKEENGRMLLSTDDDFGQAAIGRTGRVSGWFPKESLTLWDSRIGYAPNHGKNSNTGTSSTLPVHSDEASAKKYWKSSSSSNLLTNYNILDSKPSNWNEAFPPMPNITGPLSDVSNDFNQILRKVVVLVCAGSTSECEKDYNQNRADIEALLKQVEQLNVYFILDGTNSMEPYIESAKEAITEIVGIFSDSDIKDLSLGYTVYRDYDDGKNSSVPGRPTHDHPQFLKEIAAINCFSQASTRAEAFYKGLITGVEAANFQAEYAQNLLIVIGDAGNHINDKFTFADVEASLAGKKVTVFGLQTTNGAHSSYLDFTQDLIRLASLGNKNGNWKEESETKFTFHSSSTAELAAWESEPSIYIGNATGAATDPTDMKRDIVRAIKKVDAKRQQLSKQIFRSELSGKKLPNTDIDIEFGGLPASREGYIVIEEKTDANGSFVPYIFLLDREFTALQNAFRLLANAKLPAGATGKFTEYLLQTVGAITGDDLQNNQLLRQVVLEKTVNQIWLDYLQVPCELPFANYKLQDLNVAYRELGKSYELAVEEFKDQARTFSGLTNKANFEWSPVLGLQKPFYWVPFSMFPGTN